MAKFNAFVGFSRQQSEISATWISEIKKAANKQ